MKIDAEPWNRMRFVQVSFCYVSDRLYSDSLNKGYLIIWIEEVDI